MWYDVLKLFFFFWGGGGGGGGGEGLSGRCLYNTE